MNYIFERFVKEFKKLYSFEKHLCGKLFSVLYMFILIMNNYQTGYTSFGKTETIETSTQTL